MRSKVLRAFAFVLLSVMTFVGALAVTSRVRVGRFSLLATLTRHFISPGEQSHSLRRNRDAAANGPVDVVFLGSSHAYRGLDPRVFAEEGVSSFNLGSMNQTPLNSYFVAERWLPRLRPKLVVLEVYGPTLGYDGLESTRDLVVNGAWSWPTMKMAVATENVGAIVFAFAKGLGFVADESRAEQSPVPREVYVAGGHCEGASARAALLPAPASAADIEWVVVRDEQVRWLARTTNAIRRYGARVVWVTHPMPDDFREHVPNHRSVTAVIERAARDSDVPYWNFDERMRLDPLADFSDFHHLSPSGVRKWNRELLATLRREGLL